MGWITNRNGVKEVLESAGASAEWLHHANSLARWHRSWLDDPTVYATREEAESALARKV